MASYRKMTEKLMNEAATIAEERNTDITGEILREASDRIQNNGKKKAPAPPVGGISIREASRKYQVPRSSLSRWVKQGLISVFRRTDNWLYINEQELKYFLENRKN